MKIEGTYDLTLVSTHQRPSLEMRRDGTPEEKAQRTSHAEIILRGGIDPFEAADMLGMKVRVTLTIEEVEE